MPPAAVDTPSCRRFPRAVIPLSRFRRPLGCLTLAAAVLSAGTSLAAQFSPASRIDAVTVFPAGAEIERVARIDLPSGTHTLVFDALPDGVGPDDVRVQGRAEAALLIQSVDVARVPAQADTAAGEALREEREALVERKQVHEGEIRTAEIQRKMIAALTMPVGTGKDGGGAMALPPAQLFAFIADRHGEVERTVLAARGHIRAIDRRISEIDRALSRHGEEQAWQTRVSVTLEASGAGTAELKLRYRHADASWQPLYDARLDTREGDPTLRLVQRASVSQRTGEDWDGVQLKLGDDAPERGDGGAARAGALRRFRRPAAASRTFRRAGGDFQPGGRGNGVGAAAGRGAAGAKAR